MSELLLVDSADRIDEDLSAALRYTELLELDPLRSLPDEEKVWVLLVAERRADMGEVGVWRGVGSEDDDSDLKDGSVSRG